ncbi:hypothetical protein ACFL96_04490 [Thermoproteota archaeon]
MKLPSEFLEITIVREDAEYSAVCSIFPACIGKGDTEKQALSELGKAISKFLTEVMSESLESLLLSDKYTEVILDAKKTKKKKTQKRIFHLNSAYFDFQKDIVIKCDPIRTDIQSKAEGRSIDNLMRFDADWTFEKLGAYPMSMHEQPMQSPHTEGISSSNHDGLAFGFSISMN